MRIINNSNNSNKNKLFSQEIRPKAVGCGIFGRFSNISKCRPELPGDVISSAALGYVGLDVCAKLSDSRKTVAESLLDSLAGPVLRTFVQYLIAFFQLTGNR